MTNPADALYHPRPELAAAMTDSPPRRRWFTFSLRSLFLLMALIAAPLCWLGVQLKWIQDRHQKIESFVWTSTREGPYYIRLERKASIAPWSIRILGEMGYESIEINVRDHGQSENDDDLEYERFQRLFPEAHVSLRDKKWAHRKGAAPGHGP